MIHAIAALPESEHAVVVTPVALPSPQNHTFSVVTGQPDRAEVLHFLRTARLSMVAEINKSIADLFCNYFREYTNSSSAVTYTAVQLPPRDAIPARKTPFAHLNFLASPVEGLYFDPDDVSEG
jgi:hypothetical protein